MVLLFQPVLCNVTFTQIHSERCITTNWIMGDVPCDYSSRGELIRIYLARLVEPESRHIYVGNLICCCGIPDGNVMNT